MPTSLSQLASERVGASQERLAGSLGSQPPSRILPPTSEGRTQPSPIQTTMATDIWKRRQQQLDYQHDPEKITARAEKAREALLQLPDAVRERVTRRPDIQEQMAQYKKVVPQLVIQDSQGFLTFTTPVRTSQERIIRQEEGQPLEKTFDYRGTVAKTEQAEASVTQTRQETQSTAAKTAVYEEQRRELKQANDMVDMLQKEIARNKKLGLDADNLKLIEFLDNANNRRRMILTEMNQADANLQQTRQQTKNLAGQEQRANEMQPYNIDASQVDTMYKGSQMNRAEEMHPLDQRESQQRVLKSQADIKYMQESLKLERQKLLYQQAEALQKDGADDQTIGVFKTYQDNLQRLDKDYQNIKSFKRAEYAKEHVELSSNVIRQIPSIQVPIYDDAGKVVSEQSLPGIFTSSAARVTFENAIDEAYAGFIDSYKKDREQATELFNATKQMIYGAYQITSSEQYDQLFQEGYISQEVDTKMQSMIQLLQTPVRGNSWFDRVIPQQ